MYGNDLATDVQTKITGKKSACTLLFSVQHSKKYTITACRAKVKFNAQKGRVDDGNI